MMLEKYASLFSKLRTGRGRHRYPEVTKHRAPHKPFLLLSVMDLIAQGLVHPAGLLTLYFLRKRYYLFAIFDCR